MTDRTNGDANGHTNGRGRPQPADPPPEPGPPATLHADLLRAASGLLAGAAGAPCPFTVVVCGGGVRVTVAVAAEEAAAPPPPADTGPLAAAILEALAAAATPLGAKRLAALAGYPYGSRFRTCLTDLCRRGLVEQLPGHLYRLKA
jgi:hypothetical protein